MKTIFKYKLDIGETQDMEFPKGAELLSAQAIGEDIFVWAKVDPEQQMEKREIRVIGTGHSVYADEKLRHLGTTQMFGGTLIWHVFEVIK